MLTKRIIPCLDVKSGRTVKGVNFINLKDAGDPVELAKRYVEEMADELVFLDISATLDNRKTLIGLVKDVASQINIPFTVGGGIKCIEDVSLLLEGGADKVSINSEAIKRPEFINELARNFGEQCVVLAIDTRRLNGVNKVYSHGGTKPTSKQTEEWAAEAADRGAGELLLTSMDHDGTKSGFANILTQKISKAVPVPVIASGGGGNVDHFLEVFDHHADAALAASIFHYRRIKISEIKIAMKAKNIPVRL